MNHLVYKPPCRVQYSNTLPQVIAQSLFFFSLPDFRPGDALLRELPLSPFLLSALKHAAVPLAEAVGGGQKDPPKYLMFFEKKC